MKVKIPLLLLLLLAGALGYLFGTERGRAPRDEVMGKLGSRDADESEPVDTAPAPEVAPVAGDAPAAG